MPTIQQLPAINASLNALSAVLLVVGYLFIRARRWQAHRNVMVAALVSSTAFLTCYLIYHAHIGSKHFPGTGTARTVYFAILLTHSVLAATVPFLAGITVYRAVRRRYGDHRRIA